MKSIAFEKVSLADAKRVHDGVPRRLRDDWSSRRAADRAEPLREATAAWMSNLPDNVLPRHLAELFPRIVNKLCALWDDPARCSNYLKDLLIHRRSSRKGFPAAVAREIVTLTGYHATQFPAGRPWTEAH
jgi:hypothetical protein